MYDIEPELDSLVNTVPHVQRLTNTMSLNYYGLKSIAVDYDLICKYIQK